MKKDEYAILLKRVSSDTIRNFYTYETESVIKGKLDKKEKIFISDQDERIAYFGNKKILNKTNKKLVGPVLNEEELLSKYPNAKNVNEAISLYYTDATEIMTLVSYDQSRDKFKMAIIDKIETINKMFRDDQSNEIDEYQEKIDDNEDIDYVDEQNYEDIIKKVNEECQSTLILKEEFEQIISIKDLEELISYIFNLKNDKDNHVTKLSNINVKESWGMFVPDDYINLINYFDSPNKIKKFLIYIKKYLVDGQTEEKNYILYFYELFYNIGEEVLSANDINDTKVVLNLLKEEVLKAKKQFSFLQDYSFNLSNLINLLSIYEKEINEMLKLNSIISIHKAYKKLFAETEELIVKSGLDLNEYYDTDKDFLLDEDVINSKYINKLFMSSLSYIEKLDNIDEIKIFCLEMNGNFESITETLLSNTDIDIEKDEINTILENIKYGYEEIASMQNLEDKNEILTEVREYEKDEIKDFSKLYDDIMNRDKNDDKEVSIKQKKQIIIENVLKKIEKPYNKLQSLVGLEDVKEHVDKLIKERVYDLVYNDGINKRQKKYNYFFCGNPGTGKTTVAVILCEILAKLGCIKNNKIKKTTASDFIAGYVGQTALKTKELIKECRGGIIFLDEAYALASSGTSTFTQDVFGELLPAIADGEVNIILAGYNQEMKEFLDSNTGIKDRINNFFEFKDYTVNELVSMFTNEVSNYGYKVDDNALEIFKEIISKEKTSKNFGNGRVVENFTNKILDSHEQNMIDYDIEDDTLITKLDVDNAKLEETTYKEKVKKLGF